MKANLLWFGVYKPLNLMAYLVESFGLFVAGVYGRIDRARSAALRRVIAATPSRSPEPMSLDDGPYFTAYGDGRIEKTESLDSFLRQQYAACQCEVGYATSPEPLYGDTKRLFGVNSKFISAPYSIGRKP